MALFEEWITIHDVTEEMNGPEGKR
jgi:hypothetical protein